MTLLAAPLFRTYCLTGESPVWDADKAQLYWVDIESRALFCGSPETPADVTKVEVRDRVGALGMRRDGGLVLGTETGFVLDHRVAGNPIPYPGMGTGIRLNDGRVDPYGAFVCGGVAETEGRTTGLFRLAADGQIETLLDGIRCANGACWSGDGRWFYFTDTPSRQLFRYSYRPFGEPLGPPELVTSFGENEGWPDGAVVDAEDCIWIALWGSGSVVRLAPDGRRLDRVMIPTANATCPAFGGDGMRMLFVTSEGGKLSAAQRAAQPDAGFVFAVETPVAGRPEWRFG